MLSLRYNLIHLCAILVIILIVNAQDNELNEQNAYMKREHSLVKPFLSEYMSNFCIFTSTYLDGRRSAFCVIIKFVSNYRFLNDGSKLGFLWQYDGNKQLHSLNSRYAKSEGFVMESSGKY